ncbi:MAG TPA: CoA pyrophosphatase [Aggregatilineales bacterium]|nr:CoA pyrophosphatase [Aggregatilineales bacterium]
MNAPTLEHVRQALALTQFDHESAWQRMAPRPPTFRRMPGRPGQARAAGVLLLLYPHEGELAFVLTRRTDTVASHKGQVSLPGGAVEPGDEGPVDAALRETCEELAVCRDDIAVLGALTPLYVIVSDFEIYPTVGYIDARPEFRPQPSEVAAVIEVPLAALLDSQVKVEERWTFGDVERDVPFYRLDGQVVWGATAIILSEFEQRLRAALQTGAG